MAERSVVHFLTQRSATGRASVSSSVEAVSGKLNHYYQTTGWLTRRLRQKRIWPMARSIRTGARVMVGIGGRSLTARSKRMEAADRAFFIDPTRELVVARASAWPADWVEKYDDQTHAFYEGVMAFVDAKSSGVRE